MKSAASGGGKPQLPPPYESPPPPRSRIMPQSRTRKRWCPPLFSHTSDGAATINYFCSRAVPVRSCLLLLRYHHPPRIIAALGLGEVDVSRFNYKITPRQKRFFFATRSVRECALSAIQKQNFLLTFGDWSAKTTLRSCSTVCLSSIFLRPFLIAQTELGRTRPGRTEESASCSRFSRLHTSFTVEVTFWRRFIDLNTKKRRNRMNMGKGRFIQQ